MNLQIIVSEKKTERKELLRILEDVARAVAYAHAQGVIHRDLKPANVIIDKTGRTFLGDFGIARKQEGSVDHTMNFAGTPAYMAPEVWRKEISVHSDQYSFAATWFEMRTGRRVFTGQSLPEVALQHLNSPPELSGIPEAEQEALRRALAKVPDQRFPSCTEFARWNLSMPWKRWESVNLSALSVSPGLSSKPRKPAAPRSKMPVGAPEKSAAIASKACGKIATTASLVAVRFRISSTCRPSGGWLVYRFQSNASGRTLPASKTRCMRTAR